MEGISRKAWRSCLQVSMVAIAALGAGCLNNKINVRQNDAQFNERDNKIDLSVGLFLDEETRHWVHTYKKLGVTYNFALGQALENSAPLSLAKSFQRVAMAESSDSSSGQADRSMTLKFGPATDWRFGPIVMAPNHATVELLCEIRDKKGKALWTGSAVGRADKTAGMSGYLPGFGNAWLNKAYGRIFNDALSDALEKLNDVLLGEGRNPIAG